VRVWSAYTGVELLQIPLETYGTVLGFSNDNKYLISSDGSGDISIWDLSGIIPPVNYIQFDTLTRISKFAPSRDTLIASDTSRVWLLDPEGLTTLGAHPQGNSVLEYKNDIYDLVISPDSQFIGISTYPDDYIIYDLKARSSKRVTPSGEGYALAFSADSSRFITGTTDGTIETWDVKTGDPISSFNAGDPIRSIAAGPASIAAGSNDKIIILNALADQKTGELEAPGENQFVAFNSDGSMLASANSSGQVQRWKQTNGNFEGLNGEEG